MHIAIISSQATAYMWNSTYVSHTDVYVNGVQVGYTWHYPRISNYGISSDFLRVGAVTGNGNTGSGQLQGSIDELSVWTVTKSASEVFALQTQPPSGSEDGLAGYWSMNEGTGTTAYNSKTGATAASNLLFYGTSSPTWTTSNLPRVGSSSSISALFGPLFTDATDTVTSGSSANILAGIAISAYTSDVTKGVWQYKTNGTNTWVNIPDVSSASTAFVLTSADVIGFLPFGDYNGPATTFAATMIDSSATVTNGATVDASVRGGITPYSSGLVTISTTVNPTNDASVLSATLNNPTAVEVDGTNTSAGTSYVSLLSSSAVADLDFANSSFGGGSITVSLNEYVSGDVLDLPTGVTPAVNAVQVSGSNVQISNGTTWTTVGTVDSTSTGQLKALKINLNSLVTEANIGFVLDAIHYRNSSDNPTVNNTKTTRTYSVVVNDGANNNLAGGAALNSNTLTGTITITPANDLLIADLNGATAGVNNSVSWTETANANSTAVNICSNATLSDIDNNNLSQITLALTGLVDGNSEVLKINGVNFLLGTDYSSTTAGAFSVSYSTSTGLVTILPGSGATFTLANAQTLLRGITYNNTTHNPTVTPNRVISITVMDAGDDNIGGSNKVISLVTTSTISLTAVNDAPVVTAVTIAYTDTINDDTFTNTIGTLTASDGETNRNDLRFALIGSSTVSYSSGGITYDLSKSNSYGIFYLLSTTGDYLFEPNDSAIEARFANDSKNFDVTATDTNNATSSIASVTISITATDDTNLVSLGTLNNFTEQTSMVVAPNAIIDAPRDGMTDLKVQITNRKTDDILTVTVGSTGITGSYNAITGLLTFTKAIGGTAAEFQQVLRTVTFSNVSDAPDPTNRNVTVSSLSSTLDTGSFTVTQVNDAPIVGYGSQVGALVITADNGFVAYLNGVQIGSGNNWGAPFNIENVNVRAGTNILAVYAYDQGGIAAMQARLNLASGIVGTSSPGWLVTDINPGASWLDLSFDDSSWQNPVVYSGPWGNPVGGPTFQNWIWSDNWDLDDYTWYRYKFQGIGSGISTTSYTAVEQTPLTLSGTGIAIDDPDLPTGNLTATLSLTPGAHTGRLDLVPGTTGITVISSSAQSISISGTIDQINAILLGSSGSSLKFTANSDTPATSSTLTLTVNDNGQTGTGTALSTTATATINITATNDAPTLSGTTFSGTWTEGAASPLQFMSGTISIGDPDATQFNGGSLTVSFGAYVPGDVLSVVSGVNGITVSGSTVSYNGNSIGTISGGSAASLVVTFTSANATYAAVQALIPQIGYTSISENPTASGVSNTRAVTLTLNDGGNFATANTPLSASQTGSFNVIGINDPPTLSNLDATSSNTHIQGGAGTILDANATLSDTDLEALNGALGNWSGSSLTVVRTGGKR